RAFEDDFHSYIAHNRPEIFKAIVETGVLSDDTAAALEEVVVEVKKQFATTGRSAAPAADQAAQPVDQEAPAAAGAGGEQRMGARLRVYRRRVRTVQSTKKITKAMELIATSRIAKAQARINAARPYVVELTRALAALARNATQPHPMLTGTDSPQRS